MAQRAFVDTYSSYLYAICKRYTKDLPSADDCLQEALVQVLTHVKKYDDGGNFKAWISRVTVTKCLEHIRRNKRHQRSELMPENEPSYCSTMTYRLELEDVMKFMNTLPENARIAMNMYIIEGYTHREIAELLSITESSSRSLVARARKKIQYQFESERLSVVHNKSPRGPIVANEQVSDTGIAKQ